MILCPVCGAGMEVSEDRASCSACGHQMVFDSAPETLRCWLDIGRECTSACVAWDSRALGEPRLSACIHINAQRSVAKSLGDIAGALRAAATPGAPVVR